MQNPILFNPFTALGSRVIINWATYLWTYNAIRTMNTPLKGNYDFVIVGGGTAGSVLASRLSEDPKITVLLLEAGGSGSTITEVPYAWMLWRQSQLNWQIKSVPQANACKGYQDNSCRFDAGKLLGGSSAINGMTYVRGNPEDYNRWAAKGAEGWSYEEVLPYFLKSEDFTTLSNSILSTKYHKVGGPLSVEYTPYDAGFSDVFLRSAEEAGFKHGDYNEADQLKFGRIQKTKKDGRRFSADKAFLTDEVKRRTNLDIITFAHVKKITFNKRKEAVGVHFSRRSGRQEFARANEEVILSAGSLRSPQLLMLSGVGPQEILDRFDIQVVHDLPGVGKNLQDHIHTLIHSTTTRVPQVHPTSSDVRRYINHEGPLTSGFDAGMGFVKTVSSNDSRPDIQLAFIGLSPSSFPDTQFWTDAFGFRSPIYDSYFRPYSSKETTTLFVCLLHPHSIGTVELKSSNPYDNPLVSTNYYDNEADIQTMLRGIRLGMNITSSKGFMDIGHSPFDRHFPGCEGYSLYSERYLRCYIEHYTVKGDHYVGTCKMGSENDRMAVVDSKLRVRGVCGLRVVDASIMPEIPSGNTMAPTVMIAEKAADILKADYRARLRK